MDCTESVKNEVKKNEYINSFFLLANGIYAKGDERIRNKSTAVHYPVCDKFCTLKYLYVSFLYDESTL